MPDRLYHHTIDPELIPGARNAIRDCLRLQPNERITIITDEATREIAAALQAEVEEVGSESSRLRPRDITRGVRSSMPRGDPRRSGYLAGLDLLPPKRQPGELGSRCR